MVQRAVIGSWRIAQCCIIAGMAKLKELHIQCVRALKEYMQQANKTCTLMDAIVFPITHEQRLAVLEHRMQENAAQERYQIARQHFFEALNSE